MKQFFGKSFGIKYNKDNKKWEGNTLEAHNGVQLYDTFERKGQYYAYIARKSKNGINYEIVDGPTKIETPKLPPLGNRIVINPDSAGFTHYDIKVNAHNTMYHNGIQRTINFYVGEVTDKALLEKLNRNKTEAYEELLQYAKQQKNLKKDSFKDTKVSSLDYSIVKDYPIENGKYYFLYSILDNENDTYVNIEDIGIYNGDVTKDGKKGLKAFKYEPSNINSEKPQEKSSNSKTDTTIAKGMLPKAGKTAIGILIILIILSTMIVLYIKNKQYKDVK